MTYLQIHGIFVDLTLILIVAFRVVEHDIDIPHEMINGLVLFPLLLPLYDFRSCHQVELPEQLFGKSLANVP